MFISHLLWHFIKNLKELEPKYFEGSSNFSQRAFTVRLGQQRAVYHKIIIVLKTIIFKLKVPYYKSNQDILRKFFVGKAPISL